jgi:hypothetical protein
MNTDMCLREFENLAQRLGIEVRRVEDSPAGFCVIKGSKVLFIDSALDKNGQIQVFIDCFKKLDLDGIYIVPALRKILGMEDYSD